MMTRKSATAGALVVATLLLSIAVYAPGLNGPFVFDDYSNATLMTVGPDDSPSRWVQKSFENESGYLRRPIANFSFLVNHALDGYPKHLQTGSYKTTNLVIHLVNTLLCFLLVKALLALSGIRASSALLVATATAALWAVHPLQVSTVLYVTQRMTQLSALFSMLAIIAYLHYRTRPNWSLGRSILATALVAALCLLAVLSKENGALLPIYFAVCELTVLRSATLRGRTDRQCLFWGLIVLPITMGLAYFLTHISSFLGGYVIRDFSLWERLLTQVHVIAHYLKAIFLPLPHNFGFYLDDLPIVRTLSLSTAVLATSYIACIGAAIALSKKHPILSLAVLWFFVGHLLESTLLPLEMAFEHRNYLALLGPALLISTVVTNAQSERIRLRVVIIVLLASVLTLSFVTHRRASTWSDMDRFLLSEVEFRPGSFRANSEMVAYLSHIGYRTDARNHLEMMKWRFAGDARLASLELALMCGSGQLVTGEQKKTLLALARAPEKNHEAYRTFQKVAEMKLAGNCPLISARDMSEIAAASLDTALKFHSENQSGINQWRILYAVWLAESKQLHAAEQQLEKVLAVSKNNTQALISIAQLALRQGNLALAEEHLDAVESRIGPLSPWAASTDRIRESVKSARAAELGEN